MQHSISNSEILLRSKLLKNKKAPFSDLVWSEMIKCCCKRMPFIYEKLFNLMLNAGFFPKSWCEGLISPFFKSGTTTDPGNYRGICVSSCLGKFFCLTLNQRLTDFVAENKILRHPSQIGFLKENRTIQPHKSLYSPTRAYTALYALQAASPIPVHSLGASIAQRDVWNLSRILIGRSAFLVQVVLLILHTC